MPPLIQTPPGATELAALRTHFSKTFQMPGGKRRAVVRVAPVHYEDEVGALQDIDTDVQVEAGTGDLVADSLPYRFRLNGIGYDYESRRGGRARVRLVEIGGVPVGQLSLNVDRSRNGDRVTFTDVLPGLDFAIRVGRDGVHVYARIKTEDAPRSFKWHIIEDVDNHFRLGLDSSGRDGDKRRAEVANDVTDPTPLSGGRQQRFHTVTWTGRTQTRNPVTRIKSWQDAHTFPVTIDPDITETIASSADDGIEAVVAGTWGDTDYYVAIFTDNVGPYSHAGFRFTSVAVPQGATIDLATLTVNVMGTLAPPYGGGTIYGVDEDNCAAWETATRPSVRAKTTASTSFPAPTGPGLVTRDVTAIVQEQVNRAGFVSGNNLGLFILAPATPYGSTLIEDAGFGPGTDEAKLEIDYTAAAGGGQSPRTLHQFRMRG